MPKLTFSTVFFALTLLLTSCGKEPVSPLEDSSIKSIIKQAGDSISYTHLIYDSQKRVSIILDSNNNGHIWSKELQYNELGKLIRATEVHNGRINASFSFAYDNNGRIMQKLGLNNSILSIYTYDERGRLIADSSYAYRLGEISEYYTYKYDQHDNIVEKKVFRKTAGTFNLEQSVQMQYDTKKSPYHKIANSLYFVDNEGNGIEYSLSKNNLVSKSYESGTILSYIYQYSSNNLPESSVKSENNDPIITYYRFYY